MSKKIPKTLQELNLVDRFLFDEVMEIPQVRSSNPSGGADGSEIYAEMGRESIR